VPVAAALIAMLVIAGCGTTNQSATTSSAIPRELLAQARPIGAGPSFRPPATGPVLGPCSRRLGSRRGVHVEVFAADRVVIVPAGIGTRPPRSYSEGRISSAACYGDLVTLEPTGVVLVRPGLRLSLSDLFRAWRQPLAPRRLGSFTAPGNARVSVFVDGRRWRGAPGSVPLVAHSEIVLEVGPHVPPHVSYTFPPGI
jgi:hypothetical protein